MKPSLVEKIQSRGYWRVNFQPVVYAQKIPALGACRDIVERNAVRLRGWDYPHFSRRNDERGGLETAENYYLGWVDWENHIEFWHMYQSGQFLHYLALREDWFEQSSWNRQYAEQIKPMSSLSVIGGVVYQMTESFEFLCRLASSDIYEEGVRISISINNTRNRQLWIADALRAQFLQSYRTASFKIEFIKDLSKDQATQNSRDLALEAMLYFFDRFGWHNPPVETLKEDQESLLTGKI